MHWIDPACLPIISGSIDRFILNPHGRVDGMILTDGNEVHIPPHLGEELCSVAKPGQSVDIRGLRIRHQPRLIAAVAITTSDGRVIIDNGPPADHDKEAEKRAAKAAFVPMGVAGIIACLLHGPKGEVRGVLLEDGRIVRFPHDAADSFATDLKPGQGLAAHGEGLTTIWGTVVHAKAMGASPESLRKIEGKKPKHHDEHKGPKKAA